MDFLFIFRNLWRGLIDWIAPTLNLLNMRLISYNMVFIIINKIVERNINDIFNMF